MTGTIAGLAALQDASILSGDDSEFLSQAYRQQRSIEARIRLMDSTGRHEFPEDPKELAKLAYLLGHSATDQLVQEVTQMFHDVRSTFLRIFSATERDT